MDRSVVHTWLRSILTPYINADRTFADVTTALDHFPSLSPRTDLFISNVGQSSLLLQLKGTIPINYRNATYNIPVEIWIEKSYPREVPMVYVSPTKEMLVRKTDAVELDGRVGSEYVRQWNRKWESKNLLELIHSCQDVFSKQPPVYARPAGTAATATAQASSSQQTSGPSSSTSSSSSSTAKPPPPLPGQSPAFGAASSSSNGAPLRPPKPGQPVQNEGYGHARSASGGPPPAPYPGSSSRSSSGNFPPAVPNGFHPTPILQQHQQTGPYQQQQQPYPQRQGSMDAQTTGGYDNRRASGSQWAADQRRQSYQQHELNQQQQQQYQHSQGVPSPSQGPHPPQRPPSGSWGHDPRMQQYQNAPSPAPHGPQHPPQSHSRAATSPFPSGPSGPPRPGAPSAAPPIAGPPPKQDLLDSLAHDDASGASSASQARSSDSTTPAAAAPQRPLNPELLSLHTALHAKLSARVNTLRQTLQASNQHLLTIQSDLDNGPAAIEDESNRLKVVADVCKGRALKLESTLHQTQTRTQEISSRPQPPSSEIIITDSLLSNQLLTVIAQDLACTDTLYHLQRGLSNEEIGLERYLKWVRVVGREQFEKRGLGRKIERGLEGL